MKRKSPPQTPAEYVRQNFADAPSEWIAEEIARTAQALATETDSAEWRRGLVVEYAGLLAERAKEGSK